MKDKNLQKDTRKEVRRNDIILSAFKVFCEKGYSGATVNDIVKKAGCSHGLFYHYFQNKKELFEFLCVQRGKSMIDFLNEVLEEQSSYLDKLKKLTEYTFDNMKNDEIFAYRYYFFLSSVFIKAESNILPPKDKAPPHVMMFSFFDKGIKSGEFTDAYPPDELAILYNSIIQGATLTFILCPKEFKHSFKFPSIQFILDVFKRR